MDHRMGAAPCAIASKRREWHESDVVLRASEVQAHEGEAERDRRCTKQAGQTATGVDETGGTSDSDLAATAAWWRDG